MTNLSPVIEAVIKGAALCREVQQNHLVRSEKGENDPVTIADYGTQAVICRTLMMHFPHDAVISEEAGRQFSELVAPEQRAQIVQLVGDILDEPVTEAAMVAWLDHGKGRDAERTWVIDPVDGTKGFLKNRHYAIGVGILEGGTATGAVVGAPAYPHVSGGQLFYTQDGEVYMRPLQGGPARQVRVSDRTDPTVMQALESVEKGHVGHTRLARVRQITGVDERNVEQADSMEKYARIAAGDADLYLRLSRIGSTRPHSIWDHAPGAALVTLAGGTVTGLDGEPLDYSPGKILANKGVIATNGPLHSEFVAAVGQLLREEAAAGE